MDNKVRIMSEEFENTTTGEKVTGVTVMIDGKLKQMFDIMIKKSGGEKSYLEMLQEVLVMGIDEYIKKLK
jgi:DNA-binding protein YbaB